MRWVVPLIVLAGLALHSPAGAQGVTVALKSSNATVAPDSVFVVTIEVTQPGAPFNAFDAIVGYDPTALTLLPSSPFSMQEGSYMKAACGTRFHRFRQGADRDTATDVLMCNGAALTGPGQIYRLQFRASPTAQVTTIRLLPGLRFYNGGANVDLASSSDVSISIGDLTPVLQSAWGALKARYR